MKFWASELEALQGYSVSIHSNRHLGKCGGSIHAVQLFHDARVVVLLLGSSHGSGRKEEDRKSLVVHCDGSLVVETCRK